MRFVYIRDSKGFPLACAAICATHIGDHIGLSVHDPKFKFSKAFIRDVAEGRARAMFRKDTYMAFAAKIDLSSSASFTADVYNEILASEYGKRLHPRVTRAMREYLEL
jgi:hypothetical protein